jgi:hypothetical protein
MFLMDYNYFYAIWDKRVEKGSTSKKKGLSFLSNPMILLVAGLGFEPRTFGL